MLSLTPEGRGHVLSHALYPPQELEHLQAQFHERVAAGGVPQELGDKRCAAAGHNGPAVGRPAGSQPA